MASFGWKRKIGEKVSKVTSQQFEAEAADEKDTVENDEGNWLQAVKRRKEILLEGCAEKSKQLKDEGANLAENKRYREAIQKWDEALQLTPNDATLYEMKSQVLMSLHEMFPAVHAAEMAVQRNPHSWESWQTLGRAQLGLGEIVLERGAHRVAMKMSMKSNIPNSAPAAYGRYQARGRSGAVAANPSNEESKGSKLRLRPTPQHTATPDPSPTEQGQELNPQPLPLSPNRNSQNCCFLIELNLFEKIIKSFRFSCNSAQVCSCTSKCDFHSSETPSVDFRFHFQSACRKQKCIYLQFSAALINLC
uniref:Tetratricopeptide repeat domain 33 n=1 Tax=Sus scrofa TaxID=9823 RepID=A0A8D0J834_PIG